MLTLEHIDELLAWLHKYYPDFEQEPGPPSTREIWLKSLESFQPKNLRRGAEVLRAMGYPGPITPSRFAIACRGGEEFLRRHFETKWRPRRKAEEADA